MTNLRTGLESAELHELCLKIVDGSHSPPTKTLQGLPMLSARNIQGGCILFDDYRLIDPKAFEAERKRTRVSTGDVLLTIVGALGRSAVVPSDAPPFTLQRSVAVLDPIEDIDPHFLSWFFASPDFQAWMDENAKGTAQRGIYLGKLASARIPLLSLAHQHRIVAKVDSLCAKTKQAREELGHIPRLVERYKQAILAAAFRGYLTAEWRTSNGDFQWTDVSLSELIEEGPSNGWSPKSGPDASGALTLKLTATTSGYMRLDEGAVKRIYETPPPSSAYWLRPGDLLVQRANTIAYVGAAAIFDGAPNTYIYPDLMMRIRISDNVDRHYVWRFLNSEGARSYFQQNATGTAGNMPKINSHTLRALPVSFSTSREERQEIVRLVEKAFTWIDKITKEADGASRLIERLDQSILGKAFNGKLVPQDPNDEPASALLERIRAERAKQPVTKGRRAVRRA